VDADFLRAIIDKPADDGPRLVYADYLDLDSDPPQPEWAEFIRVQCELAGHEANRAASGKSGWRTRKLRDHVDRLRRRERKLFDRHKSCWFGGDSWAIYYLASEAEDADGQYPDATKAIISRGFVAEVRAPLAALVGRRCDRCEGDGRVTFHGGQPYSQVGGNPDMVDCDTCSGTGRTPGILRRLVREQPVERVVATDKRPWSDTSDGGTDYGWWEEDSYRIAQDGPNDPGNIPAPIFDLLWAANPANRRQDDTSRWVWWDEAGIAEAELSGATLRWALTSGTPPAPPRRPPPPATAGVNRAARRP
jgi:uncharacterized protein (TIGR02996 family)